MNSKVKPSHTPGPWNIRTENINGSNVYWIAEEKTTKMYQTSETVANVALISAAPDLLRALKLLIRESMNFDEVIALIAKAEGRANEKD